jgi:hypothetical protein
MANSLPEHVYINENIYYYSHSCPPLRYFCSLNLTVFTTYSTREDWVLSPNVLSPCGLSLPPTCLLVTANEAGSYFSSTVYSYSFDAVLLQILIFFSICFISNWSKSVTAKYDIYMYILFGLYSVYQ